MILSGSLIYFVMCQQIQKWVHFRDKKHCPSPPSLQLQSSPLQVQHQYKATVIDIVCGVIGAYSLNAVAVSHG